VKDVLAERILTEEQVFRMFALEDNQRNVALLRFLYYTGVRVSEACQLCWRDLIDRGNGKGRPQYWEAGQDSCGVDSTEGMATAAGAAR
jgi:integrase